MPNRPASWLCDKPSSRRIATTSLKAMAVFGPMANALSDSSGHAKWYLRDAVTGPLCSAPAQPTEVHLHEPPRGPPDLMKPSDGQPLRLATVPFYGPSFPTFSLLIQSHQVVWPLSGPQASPCLSWPR